MTLVLESADSPESNNLANGISDAQLELAVRASGYPLQRVVAKQLDERFEVTEEWGYVDRDTSDRRALDVFASPVRRHAAPSLVQSGRARI